MPILLDGKTLSPEAVLRLARPDTRGRFQKAELTPSARAALQVTRVYIEAEFMHDNAPLMYSFNTGVGLFKDRRVMMAEMAEYQQKMILAHATGIGPALDEDIVRASMVLRINAFCADYSGPRVELVDRLLACLNRSLHPIIPAQGSVGASGDLAPLAHLAGAICGMPEAEMHHRGRRMPAARALAKAGLSPEFVLGAKDASALINGSTVSLAIGVLAFLDAERLLKLADIALSLSLEALRGELAAFDPRVHAARPHPGQAAVARNVMRIAGLSRRGSEEARAIRFPDEARSADAPAPPRVQDVYSLRCAPQVHGPVREALSYIRGILSREINSATDNPLLFDDGTGGRISISGGHFHGAYVAQAMDLLSLALTDLGAISERRLARLIDPTMSYGLPRNLLAGKAGLNTGYATVQCAMSALVMENRTLSHPGSTDSIPGKSNAEDHVSNSTWCARKARSVVANVEQILACEVLMAGQALSLVAPIAQAFPLGVGSEAALSVLRETIAPALDGDRWYAREMGDALGLVRSGTLTRAVEAVTGPLE